VETETKVNQMQKQLEDLQPILIETGKETEAKLIIVTKETEEADKVKSAVSVEEADAQKIADEANTIKVDCETQLAEAIPALKAAEEAVKCITGQDIAILKKLGKPPDDVKLVTQVVCMLFGKKPEIKMNPETQRREANWWVPSLQIMNDTKFLNNLINYDKEAMT
jgi:dynein heavy chain